MTEEKKDEGSGSIKPKLAMGSIVHHRNAHGVTHAAIVTKVHPDGTASVHVFPDDAPGHHVHQVAEVAADVPDGAEPSHGWHWPKLI